MGNIIKTSYKERGFGYPNQVLFTDRDYPDPEKELVKIVEAECNNSLNLELALEFEDGRIDTCELKVQDALMLLNKVQSRYYSDMIGKEATLYRDGSGRMMFLCFNKY